MTSPSARSRPAGRYDPVRSPSVRWAIVFGLLFGVVVTLAAIKVYKQYGGLEVSFQVRGYEATSDKSVRIRFTVKSKDGKAVACLVRARDKSGVETGSALVPVAARTDGGRTTQVTYELATQARAVTGEVLTCRRPAPAR